MSMIDVRLPNSHRDVDSSVSGSESYPSQSFSVPQLLCCERKVDGSSGARGWTITGVLKCETMQDRDDFQ